MNRTSLKLIFCCVIITSTMAVKSQTFSSGTGSMSDPYIIDDAEQLDSVRNYLDSHFKLGDNIDLTKYLTDNYPAEGWLPIGTKSPDKPFTGTFNGVGYKISGLWIDRTGMNNTGLFGYINSAVIDSLNVEIDPNGITGNEQVGGLVGYSVSSNITNCYAVGDVNGIDHIGGLVGYNYFSVISNCYTFGNVNGNLWVGGLVATNDNYSAIINCYSAGNVNGFYRIGGLVGENTNNSFIENCYAVGNVGINGQYDRVGGLAGGNHNSIIKDCFFDIKTTRRENGIGYGDTNGVTGLNTDEMQQETTFATWDFLSIWGIYEDAGYPYLQSFQNNILIIPDGGNKIYDGLPPLPTIPTYTVIDFYDPIDHPLSGNLEYSVVAPYNAGIYEIVAGTLDLKNPHYQTSFKKINDTISKKDYDYTSLIPTGLTAIYGDLLKTVLLPSGWKWENPDSLVGNAGLRVHKASFTPADTVNYNIMTGIDLNVTVIKANTPIPTKLVAVYGDTLSSVNLPADWTWKNPNDSVGDAGTQQHKADFIPSDTNYNLIADTNLTIIVEQRQLYIKAEDETIDYGTIPVLAYTITSGSLVNGDVLTGKLYVDNYDIGTHIIMQGTLTAGSNYDIIFKRGLLTVLSVDVSITNIYINGRTAERNGNNFYIVSECEENTVVINVTADKYANVNINGVNQNPYTYTLTQYGRQSIEVIVTAQNGNSEKYTVIIDKPIPSRIAYYNRFEDVLTVPIEVEGVGEVHSVEWYLNGVLLDRDPAKGYIEIKETGVYFAIINGLFRTCDVVHTKATKDLTMSVYPNPAIAGKEVNISINRTADELQGASLQMFDMFGRLLQNINVNGSETSFTPVINSGIAVIKLITNSENKESKLILK